MSTTEDTASLHLADYSSLIRRRWWIVLAGLLAGALVGLVVMFVVPPNYSASANVLVSPVDVPGQGTNVVGGRTDGAINLDTEAQLVTSATVADGAKQLMKSDESATTLAGRVSVSVPPNSSVLTIEYTARTPDDAARGAHFFALAYLANRKAAAEQRAATQAKALTSQLADLRKQLKKTTSRIAALPSNSTDRQYAQAEQNVLTSQISDLQKQLTPLEDPQIDPGHIITDASPPSSPSQPVPVLFLVSGAMLGLLAGLGIAVLRDRGDHTVRRARDVQKLLDLPVLADVAMPPRPASWTTLLPSQSGAAQEIRQLQHAVTANRERHPKVLLVSSASPGPAAQVVAANLTTSLARAGNRVAHVCADFHTVTPGMLGVATGPGLAEILLGERTVDFALQRASVNDLVRVIGPGQRLSEVKDTLRTDDLRAIVSVLSRDFDQVVLETPPTTVNADAQAWAQFGDVAVVVVEQLYSRREDVLDSVEQLERVGCETLGVVVLPRHPKALDTTMPDYTIRYAGAAPEDVQPTAPTPVNGTADAAAASANGTNGNGAASTPLRRSRAITTDPDREP
ncbi:MAG TPA: Wzz/FepE/Etk N-terminal domain-containing protein [Streptosporangiales bacterium]